MGLCIYSIIIHRQTTSRRQKGGASGTAEGGSLSSKSGVRRERRAYLLLVFVLLLGGLLACVELGNLGFDSLLPLSVREARCAIFLRLRRPVLRLVRRLKGGVFSDGSVRIFVDILYIFGTNAIF